MWKWPNMPYSNRCDLSQSGKAFLTHSAGIHSIECKENFHVLHSILINSSYVAFNQWTTVRFDCGLDNSHLELISFKYWKQNLSYNGGGGGGGPAKPAFSEREPTCECIKVLCFFIKRRVRSNLSSLRPDSELAVDGALGNEEIQLGILTCKMKSTTWRGSSNTNSATQ